MFCKNRKEKNLRNLQKILARIYNLFTCSWRVKYITKGGKFHLTRLNRRDTWTVQF